MIQFEKGKKAPPFDSETARELGKKGGKVSGKVRRMKRSLREWAQIFRDMPVDGNPKMTMGGAVALKMYAEAINGDVKAARFLAELQGEMEEQIAIKEIPKLVDDI